MIRDDEWGGVVYMSRELLLGSVQSDTVHIDPAISSRWEKGLIRREDRFDQNVWTPHGLQIARPHLA